MFMFLFMLLFAFFSPGEDEGDRKDINIKGHKNSLGRTREEMARPMNDKRV